MISDFPWLVEILFLFTALATILLFHYSNGRPKILTILILLWSIAQCLLAYSGFYQVTDTIPPRFALVLLPPTVFIIIGLWGQNRKWILARRNTTLSTFLHTVRLPVEIVLLQLYLHGTVPELMTFEGRNFDILAGITAPIIGFFYIQKIVSIKILLVWNIICLGLVSFILVNGVLSAELPIQQFAFDQPNRGLSYFPFVMLPTTIVPLVIYTHITDILKLNAQSKIS